MSNEFFTDWSVRFTKLLIQDFKLSPLDCHAILGNAGAESNGFKSLQEIKPLVKGSAGGYGIMQWTGPRRRLYESYCSRNGLKPSDMMSNYKFLFVELNGDEGKGGQVLARVKTARTLEAKTEVFMKEFLRPGIPHLDGRIRWAKIAQTAWGDLDRVDQGGVTTGNGTSVRPIEDPKPVEPQTPSSNRKPQSLVDILIQVLKVLFGGRS